jgi:hypothetical protein
MLHRARSNRKRMARLKKERAAEDDEKELRTI